MHNRSGLLDVIYSGTAASSGPSIVPVRMLQRTIPALKCQTGQSHRVYCTQVSDSTGTVVAGDRHYSTGPTSCASEVEINYFTSIQAKTGESRLCYAIPQALLYTYNGQQALLNRQYSGQPVLQYIVSLYWQKKRTIGRTHSRRISNNIYMKKTLSPHYRSSSHYVANEVHPPLRTSHNISTHVCIYPEELVHHACPHP